MKPIDRSEILPMGEYEIIRDRFRSRVIAEKKIRRVKLGDKATALFENRDTMMMQIQEMLRTERITRESGILHEIETYNELVPGDNQLSLTVMIEIEDDRERDGFLSAAKGIENGFSIRVGNEEFAGKIAADRVLEDRASAVIYLKFDLSDAAVVGIRGGKADIELRVSHPAFSATTSLPAALVGSLAEDFS